MQQFFKNLDQKKQARSNERQAKKKGSSKVKEQQAIYSLVAE